MSRFQVKPLRQVSLDNIEAKFWVMKLFPEANARKMIGPLGAKEHVIRAYDQRKVGASERLLGRGRKSTDAWKDAANDLADEIRKLTRRGQQVR